MEKTIRQTSFVTKDQVILDNYLAEALILTEIQDLIARQENLKKFRRRTLEQLILMKVKDIELIKFLNTYINRTKLTLLQTIVANISSISIGLPPSSEFSIILSDLHVTRTEASMKRIDSKFNKLNSILKKIISFTVTHDMDGDVRILKINVELK